MTGALSNGNGGRIGTGLLPQLEATLIELVRLEELKHREQLRLAGVLPTAPGLLIGPKADGQPTTAEDFRKVLRFQTALFSDKPEMNAGGVYSSSLHLGWWRGFEPMPAGGVLGCVIGAYLAERSSSWLNMRDLTQNRLRRGVFRDVEDLIKAVGDYIDRHNESLKPFILDRQGKRYLGKVKRRPQIPEYCSICLTHSTSNLDRKEESNA